MFPNSHDALPLPPHPNLEHYRKRAKDLSRIGSDGPALNHWIGDWLTTLTKLSHQPVSTTPDQLAQFVLDQTSGKKLSLSRSQFILARAHGFQSWPKFTKHLESLSRPNSPISHFEHAADAIVAGDLDTLRTLLAKNPALARARSTREHSATLLHYVAANGVENYRQKTPPNAATIATLLLDAGADVNATADLYDSEASTLSLVATSIHPEQAGLQESLIDLLLARGASLDHPSHRNLIASCLANGRLRAAQLLAARGAHIDLESAAGLGRLDQLHSFIDVKGMPSRSTKLQLQRGFLWACEYGHNDVIEFLLQRGADIRDPANTGQTALHWAVIGAQPETIRLLLSRGANCETKNAYGGTALGQALWSSEHASEKEKYIPVIKILVEAGAK
jgi:hypothetical protein